MAASSWYAIAPGVTFASGKSLLDVFNATSTRVVSVHTIGMRSVHHVAVTGVMTACTVNRLTSGVPTGGNATNVCSRQPVTSLEQWDRDITIGIGRNPTRGAAFRQWYFSTEDLKPGNTVSVIELLQTCVPLTMVWSSLDPSMQPLVCREMQGIEVRNEGTSAVASCDVDVEMVVT